MCNNMKTHVISVIMALVTLLMLGCAAGCGSNPADDQAAIDVIVRYFAAHEAQDAEALTDIICCKPVLDTFEDLGMTRDDYVSYMQGSIDAAIAVYGDSYSIGYDEGSFVVEDASDELETLNSSLGLTDAFDAAKYVSVSNWMIGSDGSESEPITSTMIVYRYNGEWYLGGSSS